MIRSVKGSNGEKRTWQSSASKERKNSRSNSSPILRIGVIVLLGMVLVLGILYLPAQSPSGRAAGLITSEEEMVQIIEADLDLAAEEEAKKEEEGTILMNHGEVVHVDPHIKELRQESIIEETKKEEVDDERDIEESEGVEESEGIEEKEEVLKEENTIEEDKNLEEELPPKQEEEIEVINVQVEEEHHVAKTTQTNGEQVGDEDMGGTFDGQTMHIHTQVTLPPNPIFQHLDDSQNFWPMHAILKSRGWKFATTAAPNKVNLWFTKGKVPSSAQRPSSRGKTIVNSIGLSGCIGGAKTLQLECRRRLATHSGCQYDELGIQPVQYNMLDLEDCRRFVLAAREAPHKLWLSKPSYTFHGSGISVHKGLPEKYAKCKKPQHLILMEYVDQPATIGGGHKFDFRTYLLVASLKPKVVFVHDGFVRKSDKVYDKDAKNRNVHITNSVGQSHQDHFFNFSRMSHELQREMVWRGIGSCVVVLVSQKFHF